MGFPSYCPSCFLIATSIQEEAKDRQRNSADFLAAGEIRRQ
jgi:hypothetical protein